jgi:N-acetylneuraminic acid mutarotase
MSNVSKNFGLFFVVFSLFVLLIMPLSSLASLGENGWVSKSPLPAGTEVGAAAVNGEIYAVGGYSTSGGSAFSNINQRYDTIEDTWGISSPMPTARVNFGIAAYQNKIYVIGGEEHSHAVPGPNFLDCYMQGLTGVNEVYDPENNAWETKTPMPTPRNYLQANIVDNKIYLVGGLAQQELEYPPSNHFSDANEVYDPQTDTWTTMASIPTPVWGYCSAVFDNKIYIISGWSGDSSLIWGQRASLSSLVQIFDPNTNSWTTGTSIPTPVTLAGCGATDGTMAPSRIYVFGGCPTANTQEQSGINATQIYNPKTDSWSIGAEMPTARYGLAVAAVDDTFYAIGGESLSVTPVNEMYTPLGYGEQPTQPTSSSTTYQENNQNNSLLTNAVIAAAIAGAVSVGVIVYFKKRH